jgi:ketopantoate reductase
MGKSLDVLVIGGGPISALMTAATTDGLTVGCSVFEDRIDELKKNGIRLDNRNIKDGLTPPFYERDIPGDSMAFDPETPLSGGISVYPSSYGGQLSPNIKLIDDPLIIFGTKTPDNVLNLNQVQAILAQARNPTILVAQNGFAPEILISEELTRRCLDHVNVVRSVAMGPITPKSDENGRPYLLNNIPELKFGHWEAGEGHQELSRRVAEMFSYIPITTPGDDFREEGSEKALVNLINPITILFANTIGEALGSYLIRQFYKSAVNEGIECLSGEGVNVNPVQVLDLAWKMYNSARPHMASMGNDPMNQYRTKEGLFYPLATEVDGLSGHVMGWGKEHGINTFWNSFLFEMLSDFTDSYNAIKDQDPIKAVEFGVRFAYRNRWIAGFTENETYNLGKFGPNLEDLDKSLREKFEEDTSSPQSVYLCPHVVFEDTKLKNLPALLVASYRALKEEYHSQRLLADMGFELSQGVCNQADACKGLERRACYNLRG